MKHSWRRLGRRVVLRALPVSISSTRSVEANSVEETMSMSVARDANVVCMETGREYGDRS